MQTKQGVVGPEQAPLSDFSMLQRCRISAICHSRRGLWWQEGNTLVVCYLHNVVSQLELRDASTGQLRHNIFCSFCPVLVCPEDGLACHNGRHSRNHQHQQPLPHEKVAHGP